ncbi:hypothetical protein [Pseudomonas benzenivorans]|uniref:HEPN domain-containing protein n=1 Tax=Pseudomonas benzenivorans TaxID=556533 RepID=A0ABY5HAM4_9PSED|nr:hypothetical protein [Pseudomonas benzenivorans]UTW09325.1 hypothetical protein KDW96_08510 [Pseudomonas benzenivorans]
MKFPNWLKLVWWGIALIGTLAFLIFRLDNIHAGHAQFADVVVFLVFICLWMLPLVAEVNMLGIHLKNEIEEIKREVASVRNSVDVRNSFSPQLIFPQPPSEEELPGLREEVRAAVSQALREAGSAATSTTSGNLSVSEAAHFLFGVRYNLELQLRRIYEENINDPRERYASVIAYLRLLVRSEVISPNLAHAIREVYSVCSAAIHGEDVSENQVQFVRDVAPELVAALEAVR